ncbi:MAG: hypothetical protein JO156_14665 [Solirubrobacterales bacterium]|nr:hypothetical protein [Solirubrobacterales bacterium]
MPVQMFDSTTVGEIPGDAPAVAGYVGGFWPTYLRLLQNFPRAYHLSIAVNSGEDAECLDIERGDATPYDAPGWVRRQMARGVRRPVLYASVSTMNEVVAAIASDGINAGEVRLWTAHYTGSPHICGPQNCGYGLRVGADATQWTDRALARNLDESLCGDSFFGPPPPPPDPHHYDWYPVGPFAFRDANGQRVQLDERATVQEYDHLRIHPRMNAERLRELHEPITFLRKRVWYVAHYDLRTGTKLPAVEWGSYFRGWRWQMLLARSRGEQVVQ